MEWAAVPQDEAVSGDADALQTCGPGKRCCLPRGCSIARNVGNPPPWTAIARGLEPGELGAAADRLGRACERRSHVRRTCATAAGLGQAVQKSAT